VRRFTKNLKLTSAILDHLAVTKKSSDETRKSFNLLGEKLKEKM
jgi:hypothetical protein